MSPENIALLERLRLRDPAMYRYWLQVLCARHRRCGDPACLICQYRGTAPKGARR